MPAVTLQLCTFNRAHLLGRVLDGCFEQSVTPENFEVVVVDDGSTDATPAVIEAAKARAPVSLRVVTQANAGLARARNAGIAASRGDRLIFIDDDVLPMPTLVAEHLRSAAKDPDRVVRGAVIEVESFERLPPPIWSLRDYSANWFWTSNVSVSRRRLDAVALGDGAWFDPAFSEYGWEDIELGLRLRDAGTRAVFNKRAVAFHYKPPLGTLDLERLERQKRAQARTARLLAEKHPGWRVALATGDHPLRRGLHRASRRLHLDAAWRKLGGAPRFAGLAAHALAGDAYFDELDRLG